MQSRVNKGQDSQSRAAADRSSASKHTANTPANLTDNRPEALQLEMLQLMTDNSPQAASIARLQAMANSSPNAVAQRALQEKLNPGTVQRQEALEEEELQIKGDSTSFQPEAHEESGNYLQRKPLAQRQVSVENGHQATQEATQVAGPRGKPEEDELSQDQNLGSQVDTLKSRIERLRSMINPAKPLHFSEKSRDAIVGYAVSLIAVLPIPVPLLKKAVSMLLSGHILAIRVLLLALLAALLLVYKVLEFALEMVISKIVLILNEVEKAIAKSIANTKTKKKERERERGTMRFQIQWKKGKKFTRAQAVWAKDEKRGVTGFDATVALKMAWAKVEFRYIQKACVEAMTLMAEWIVGVVRSGLGVDPPPGGSRKEVNQEFWSYPGVKESRIDAENPKGHNLRYWD